MKMGTNIYYLELMLIFLNVILAVEIDEEGHTERYFWVEKTRSTRN